MKMFTQTTIVFCKIAIVIVLSILAMLITAMLAGIYDPQPIIGPDFGFGWAGQVGCAMLGAAAVSFITCLFFLEHNLRAMLRWWMLMLIATNLLAAVLIWINALCKQDYVYSL